MVRLGGQDRADRIGAALFQQAVEVGRRQVRPRGKRRGRRQGAYGEAGRWKRLGLLKACDGAACDGVE